MPLLKAFLGRFYFLWDYGSCGFTETTSCLGQELWTHRLGENVCSEVQNSSQLD